MRIIELSSNKKSFRTVRFNPNGLSIVVGRKSDPDDHDRSHSYNGVGKSLLIYLINFCLGAKANPTLGEKLPGWEFCLKFELKNKNYEVVRSTASQNKVQLDEEEMSLTTYTDLLGDLLFDLKSRVKFLTYRCLVSQFVRQGKPGYISYNQTANGEKQYQKQIRSAYLLGLDEKLVNRKRELREESVLSLIHI